MNRRLGAPLLLAALLIAMPGSASDQPTLATVLQRAAAYVADFHQSAVRRRRRGALRAGGQGVREARRTDWPSRRGASCTPICCSSGRPAAATGPSSGTCSRSTASPVRDRTERLTRLFLEGSPSAQEQIGKILDESSRFNIGDIKRNINTPVFALQILEHGEPAALQVQAHERPRPGDRRRRDEAVAGAFRAAAEVWAVEFEEQAVRHADQDRRG